MAAGVVAAFAVGAPGSTGIATIGTTGLESAGADASVSLADLDTRAAYWCWGWGVSSGGVRVVASYDPAHGYDAAETEERFQNAPAVRSCRKRFGERVKATIVHVQNPQKSYGRVARESQGSPIVAVRCSISASSERHKRLTGPVSGEILDWLAGWSERDRREAFPCSMRVDSRALSGAGDLTSVGQSRAGSGRRFRVDA